MAVEPDFSAAEAETSSERRRLDLRLAVGTPLHLQVISEKHGLRVQARVLGYLEGHSILAVMPATGLSPADLRLGDELAVRYLVGRSVYGFASQVIRLSTSPYPYFHLAYPQEVEKMDVRQAERVAVAVPVRIQAAGTELDAELRDLSASGAMVHCQQRIGEAGEAVRVCFQLTFGDVTRSITTGAAIRNTSAASPGGDDAAFLHGIQFQGLDENDRVLLRGFVFEQLVARSSVSILAPAAAGNPPTAPGSG